MKALLTVFLILLLASVQTTPAVASAAISKANEVMGTSSDSNSSVASLIERCEKNIALFKGKLIPDVYSFKLIEDYYSKREIAQKVVYEMNDAEFVKAAVHLKKFRDMGVSETLAYCDKEMHDVYKRFINAFNDNASAEEYLVANIHKGDSLQLEADMLKVGDGILDTEIDLTSKDANLGKYQDIIIKSNQQDGEWVLTNSLQKLATYEMLHDKVAKIIVVIKKPGQPYTRGSSLHQGYYKLHGSYAFEVMEKGVLKNKDLLVFEQITE